MQNLVLGVDAGNTKTIALVARFDGTVVGAGRGCCGDIYGAGSAQAALAAVRAAITQALTQCGRTRRCVASACFSMAGADWPDDFELLRHELRGWGKKITVVNDAIGALFAGSDEGWGVAVACGTGAGTSAISRDGTRLWHSSWWQQGGGGRELGGQALQAVFRSELGMAPPTLLTQRILDFYGCNTVDELLYEFTRRVGRRLPCQSKLARIVLDCAAQGDSVALAIVQQEAVLLAGTATVAAAKVGIAAGERLPLVFAGSVFNHHCCVLPEAIVSRVREQFPSVDARKSDLEPGAGALLMALKEAGVVVDEEIRARVRSTLPEPTFFTT